MPAESVKFGYKVFFSHGWPNPNWSGYNWRFEIERVPRHIFKFPNGPLAQSVEQLTFNQLVVGSNPTRPTIKISNLAIIRIFH